MGNLTRILDVFYAFTSAQKVTCVVISLLIVSILDLWTGFYLSFSVFYVLPVSFAAWGFGRRCGLSLAFASALIWSSVSFITVRESLSLFIQFWNFLIHQSFLGLFAIVLSELHVRILNEERLADTDGLTGLFNKRACSERFYDSFYVAKRYQHPLTIAYLDLDNFKGVNDAFGHAAGDQVLKIAANFMMNHTRLTDICGRFGGDEFVVVLPETDFEGAHIALINLQTDFNQEMKNHQWPVTMSIGAMSYTDLPEVPDVMIEAADKLMYAVKKKGKNRILHERSVS